MAHFAEIDYDGTVKRVVVVDNRDCMTPQGVEMEEIGVVHLVRTFGGGIWKQCSYNGRLRMNFPAAGYAYDSVRDAFIPPKPYPSWSLDEGTCLWVAPVPYPAGGLTYIWDEAAGEWVRP